jgi:hypothetical protein
VVADTIKIKEGGRIRHIFFDAGRDQLIAFMEARGVPNVPTEYDAGINRGLGVPAGFYHFVFEGIAARCATLPRMTRLCRSASRWGALRWISTTRRSPKSPRHNRFAASTNLNYRASATVTGPGEAKDSRQDDWRSLEMSNVRNPFEDYVLGNGAQEQQRLKLQGGSLKSGPSNSFCRLESSLE